MPMKLVIILLALVFVSACSAQTPVVSIRAAYLTQESGQLPQKELDQHPEILVTHNFDEYKQAARQRIALWIDKSAIELVEEGWLDVIPQASYPIILVGYNDPLLAFKYSLTICCFLGPVMPDFSDAEPGFSVIGRANGQPGASVIMLQGFKQTSTLDDILKISNALLEGQIIPTPTLLPKVSMPTPTPE
jgi:hypothetical protein